MGQAADLFAKAKMQTEVVKWLERQIALKGSMSEADHYKLTNAALLAKDYVKTIQLSKNYMAAYPDRPQPYTFYKKAALASDPDTTSGSGVEYLKYLDSVYSVVNKEKFKKAIFLDQYYSIIYFINKFNNLKKSPDFKVKSDGSKTEVVEQFLATCQQAIAIADNMLLLYPDAGGEENKFAIERKTDIQKNIDYYSKPPAKKTAASGGAAPGSPKG